MAETLEVRFVDLPAMTVASALGFGKEPEYKAAQMMSAFTAPRGIEAGSEDHPSFGFNNPNPSPGSENSATSCGFGSIQGQKQPSRS